MRRLSFLVLFVLVSCESPVPKLALGTLERDRVAHSAAASEMIIALPAAQGSTVQQGDVLATLDDTLQKAQVRRAEAELAQADAQLDKLRNGAQVEEIAAATAKVTAAQAVFAESIAQYERLRGLLTQNIASKGDMDKALSARDVAKANLQARQEELRLLLKGSREEDLRAAKSKVAAAAAVLSIEKKKLADLTVIAACAGILDDLPWHVGERPAAGAPLAVVLAGASYIRGYIFDCLFAGVQFSFSGYFCAYGKSGLSFLHNTLSILLVRVPGAYLASKFFPQTLLPMGLASACGSLFSILVCVIAYHWLKRQQKAVLHG